MITLVSAPTNLGLRPPIPGSVPGTAKAPEALREAGLFAQFVARGAADGGVVLPGRYVDDDAIRPAGQVRNEAQLVEHARRLSLRITDIIDGGHSPLVLGGDCSLLLAAGHALAPLGNVRLVHIDGHTDFRHPGNSEKCASVAGEDLAAAVGKHWPTVANIDGRGPYFSPASTVHIGCRENDEQLEEAREALALVVPAQQAMRVGMADVVGAALATVAGTDGYWLQVDVDMLDPEFMPAVDSPDPGGFTPDQLVELLRGLAPRAIGASITVFDPDLDSDGKYATLLTEVLAAGLADLGAQYRLTRAG